MFDVEMSSPNDHQVSLVSSHDQTNLGYFSFAIKTKLLHTSFLQSEDDGPEKEREEDIVMNKEVDWVADWSSRPENIPPK